MQSLRRFNDFVRSQATRADSDTFGPTINDRFNPLNVGFESPPSDVVGVTDVSSNGRTFSTDVATLCHSASTNPH